MRRRPAGDGGGDGGGGGIEKMVGSAFSVAEKMSATSGMEEAARARGRNAVWSKCLEQHSHVRGNARALCVEQAAACERKVHKQRVGVRGAEGAEGGAV